MSDESFITVVIPASAKTAMDKAGLGLGYLFTNMFTTGASASGNTPATHYIASGMALPRFVDALKNATLDDFYNFVQERLPETGQTFPFTKSQVKTTLQACDISQDPPDVVLSRMGLKIINAPR
jgi:hypothetical protein